MQCVQCGHALPSSASTCPACGTPVDAVAGGSQAHVSTRIASVDIERDRKTKFVEVPTPAVVRRIARQQEREAQTAESAGDEALFSQLHDAIARHFKRMPRDDRYAWWSATIGVLSVFLPWNHVSGIGIMSGIEGRGALVLGALLITLAALHLRIAHRHQNRVLWLVIQLLAAAGATFVVVSDLTHVPFGPWRLSAALTAICGTVAVLFTLLRTLTSGDPSR